MEEDNFSLKKHNCLYFIPLSPYVPKAFLFNRQLYLNLSFKFLSSNLGFFSLIFCTFKLYNKNYMTPFRPDLFHKKMNYRFPNGPNRIVPRDASGNISSPFFLNPHFNFILVVSSNTSLWL